MHAPLAFDGGENVGSPSTHSKLRLHPHLLAYPIRLESTDEELAAVLENQVIRLENVLSSLQIRALGPIADILAALGDTISPPQRELLRALRA